MITIITEDNKRIVEKVIDPFGVIENIAGLMVDKKFP
jgi:hypothetical protein